MKSDPFAPCPFQNHLEPLADIAGVDGLVRLDAGGEHQFREDALFILRQQLHHGRRQDDGAVGRPGFGFADDQLAAHGADLLVDAQFPDGEVQVLPPEGQQFAPAHTGGQLQQEELIHSLSLGLDEEALNLLLGQDLHLFPFQGRELAAHRRVGVDQLLLHRLVQGHLADGVAAAHRTVRHIGAPLLHIGLPSAFLHLPEELLELRLGQLVQRNLS